MTIYLTTRHVARLVGMDANTLASYMSRGHGARWGACFPDQPGNPGSGSRRLWEPVDVVIVAMLRDTYDVGMDLRILLAAEIRNANERQPSVSVYRGSLAVTFTPDWSLLQRASQPLTVVR